jgi:uncharacterized protein YjiS (DUF1127 family)
MSEHAIAITCLAPPTAADAIFHRFSPAQLLQLVKRKIAHRAARAALHGMSADELRDIGLERGEINHAVSGELRRVHSDF